MPEPGAGAGSLEAIAAAIMAGEPESIRRAGTAFGDASNDYGQAGQGYQTDTKSLMTTWEGGGADAYQGVANRTVNYLQTTADTIAPNQAALTGAAQALDEAQRAITEYLARAAEYRTAMAANEQAPDEAALAEEAQKIQDRLAHAYRAALTTLKPIETAEQTVGKDGNNQPKANDPAAADADPDAPDDAPADPPADPPGAADVPAGAAPDAPAAGPDGAPGDLPGMPPGANLVTDGTGLPGDPGDTGQPAPAGLPAAPTGLVPATGGTPLSTTDNLVTSTVDGYGPAPGVPVVPGIGSPLGPSLVAGPAAGVPPTGVGTPGTGCSASTRCTDPSCADPGHGIRPGELPMPSIGGHLKTPVPAPGGPGGPAIPGGPGNSAAPSVPGGYSAPGLPGAPGPALPGGPEVPGVPATPAVAPALSTPGTTLNTFGSRPDAVAAVVGPTAPAVPVAAGAPTTAGLGGIPPLGGGMPALAGGAALTSATGTTLASSRFPGGSGPEPEPAWQRDAWQRPAGPEQPAGSGRPAPAVPVAGGLSGGLPAGPGRGAVAGRIRVLGSDDWDDADAVTEAIGRPR